MPLAPSTAGPNRVSFRSIPFFLVHLAAVVGVVLLGWSWKGLALALLLYFVRMFGVTAGYHRYFSHRTFKTSRLVQFFFALLATSSAQKGVIWWAAHHRAHHKHSDLPGDVHSVKLDGFVWSHVGWIISRKHEGTDESRVKDLLQYPELRWLDRWFLVPPVVLGLALFAAGGAWALVWGMFVSTTLLWHGTFTINSLTHVFGSRRYETTDDSRNNLWLALITMGEGWHNNHHYYQRSVNQGFFWWEIDVTYYLLRAMAAVGLVWDLHTPPARVRDAYLKGDEAPARIDVPAAELAEPAA
jgi:stearoyl-CoA desaturase (delta-9 desaturase)